MAISEELQDLISSLRPVDVPAVPCSECAPTVDGRNVTRAPMCPAMLSIDDATAGDRIWFETHPFSDYYRPITWSEAADLVAMNDQIRQPAIGEVVRLPLSCPTMNAILLEVLDVSSVPEFLFHHVAGGSDIEPGSGREICGADELRGVRFSFVVEVDPLAFEYVPRAI